MSSNWVMALDNLAAGGVLDMDFPAYLLDQKPRYVGHPPMDDLSTVNPMYLPAGTKLKDLPSVDTFGRPEDKPLVQNPSWKKVLFGSLVVGSIAAAVIGVLAKFGKLPKGINISSLKTYGQTAMNYIKKPFVWVASKIKKP
jgi:hypothetical protein